MVLPVLLHSCCLFLTAKPSSLIPPISLSQTRRAADGIFSNRRRRGRRRRQSLSLLHHHLISSRRRKDEFQVPISILCNSGRKISAASVQEEEEEAEADGVLSRGALQIILWVMEGIYILWLFILPFAPGDPVWAISSETIQSLVSLSLNFFFILPLMNSVGINLLEAPVLHPMSEGLFNFVIAWTLMFAPLLFMDYRQNRYKGSLDVLWGFQMFLTNTFLIPYMAIRLNNNSAEFTSREQSKLGALMTKDASIVGLVGGSVCVISVLWAFFGRMNGDFGGVAERWNFLLGYLGSERLAYAFIWDIVLYSIFQPWLIGDNLQNLKLSSVGVVSKLRFVPVVGLIAYLAYLACLSSDQEA